MPPARNQPARISQRRNSQQDDTPARTRGARGAKSAPSRPDQPEFVPSKPSPTKLSPTTTRKTTRSASNISVRSFETAPDVYASYEEPLFMVFGLSPEFFDGLKKHHGKLPKERKSLVSSLPLQEDSLEDEDSDSEEVSVEESEGDEAPVAHAAPRGRGRGGRGSRGVGRGRGGRGRGRGRGGRPRGGLTRAASPMRARISRNPPPMHSLTEEDDNGSANQGALSNRTKPISDEHLGEAVDSDDEDDNAIADDDSETDGERIQRTQKASRTPESSPPPGLQESVVGGRYGPSRAPESDLGPSIKPSKNVSISKTSLPTHSASHTPRNGASTPAESAVPRLLRPEDDVLSESDLPEPWIEDAPVPIEAECEDRADYLLQTRFKPMIDVQVVIANLTKYAASQRSTESLYALAKNTQNILKEWQDQYLMLDSRTAPHMHPAKKACNGGRIPTAPDVYEVMKEAELYGYNYDPKKLPEAQDPWAQRPGAEKSGGRELRTRRGRDMLESAPASEEEEDEDGEGRPAKRQRRATRKFDGSDAGTGTNTPKKHNGWGGARKKGVSRFQKTASETPEPESRPTKRARVAASNLLHQRIQEMKDASLAPSSGDEDSSVVDADDYSDSNTKRGRPAGSKNVARRSDYGVKKGPRKKTSEASTPVPSVHGPNAPPPALQSMSEGQGQFSLDPEPLSAPPPLLPNAAETVFQATPQPSAVQDAAMSQPDMVNAADAYMSTAPLSQYTSNYEGELTPPGGSRRKPRVKSEKRSQSMTIWWAERKARKKEADEKNGTYTTTPDSRPGSSNDKRGGRASTGSAALATSSTMPPEPLRRSSLHYPEHPHHHAPPDGYGMHHGPPPLSAPAPHYMYASAPPPHPMMMPYSGLAAIPSGSYPFSAPPPLSSQYGPRALAPAPLLSQQQQQQQQQQPPSYPSPYGPQSPAGSRPKSSGQHARNGPPTLAPAPSQHFSPYAPLGGGRDVPFKVMVPGPPPGEARRGSR